jgi:small subunit ribosomal protein S21
LAAKSKVVIRDDENFGRALKRFEKKCEKVGTLSDLRKHPHYEKPSENRKRRRCTAVRNAWRGPRVARV